MRVQRARHLGDDRAQQAGGQGVRHRRIAGACLRLNGARLRLKHLKQQPAFAHARFARQAEHLPTPPGGHQGLHLIRAPDQARWAQQAGGQRLRRDRKRWRLRGADGCQQRQRFSRRRHPHLMLEHLLTAVKRQHRGGAVTVQVMQANNAPVSGLGQWVRDQQRLRMRHRQSIVAGKLGLFALCHPLTAAPRLAKFPLVVKPML